MTTTKTRIAILTGSTFPVRAILKANGWTWDESRKAWTMADDWDDEAHVERRVRGYGGIRNRGVFSVTFADSEDARNNLLAEIEAADLESPEQVADLVLSALDERGEQAAREQLMSCIAIDERQAGSRVVTAWDGDRDCYGVRDADGISVWWPEDDAQDEIQAAADPRAAVLAMCRLQPMRGTWSN